MMYKNLAFLIGLVFFQFSCDSESSLTLKNNLKMARHNEPIVINRADFDKQFGQGGREENICLKQSNGEFIPYQLDDLDKDGEWDELVFEVNLEAGSSMVVDVCWMPQNEIPVFENSTQVYLARKNEDGSFTELQTAEAPRGLDGFPSRYQSEGVAWENDKIAFRSYFDCRNTKDLFGKLSPELILHKAGTPELGSYHQLASWGMDILHCGSSLGAGGLALIEEDSLYRLGSTSGYHFTAISEGPIRAIFELEYTGWQVGDQSYKVVERISLWKGKYWFVSEVQVGEFEGIKQLATGIVTTKMDREPVQFTANHEFTAIMAHGNQSLNNDMLAMAVLARSEEISIIGHTQNLNYYDLGIRTVPSKKFSQAISETYYLGQKIKSQTPSVHYFFAMWGLENADWNNTQLVKKYISDEAEKLSHPVEIEY